MPSLEDERTITLRRFEGTNILLDSAYLGPSYLASSQNWIPGNTFRLTKMPGTIPYQGGNIPGAQRVQALRRVYDPAGQHRYLYAVVTPVAAGNDQLWVSIDDALWTQVPAAGGGNTTFLTRGGTYGMDDMQGILYVGNGAVGPGGPAFDPILEVPFGGSSSPFSPLVMFTDTSGVPTQAPDTTFGNTIISGSYSYAWCIFDNANSIFLERGTTKTVVVDANATAQALTFPPPVGFASNGGVLSARFQAHLFIAPINLPIELAHDQTTAGVTSAVSTTIRQVTAAADGQLLPSGQIVTRIGRMFRWHGGRLWISGDSQNPTAVWATSVLVPGLEQQIFNAGLFFPQDARTPRTPDPVTAIGTAFTTDNSNPDAPIAITTLSRTFLFYGDILDDPSAEFMQVSRKAGCISSECMTETAFGLFYVGLRSVYMIPVGGGSPQDVGWPIRPSIEQIPVGSRQNCTMRYHKGFLKLAIVPPGSTTASVQWWLDLRRGLGAIPSWWGPHVKAPISAWCTADQDPLEPDRGIHAIDGLPKQVAATTLPGCTATVLQITATPLGAGGFAIGDQITVGPQTTVVTAVDSATQIEVVSLGSAPAQGLAVIDQQACAIELIHQNNTWTENNGSFQLISTLVTGELDDGRPFERKNYTRVRVTAFPSATTQFQVGLTIDAAVELIMDAMMFTLSVGGAHWNVDQWNIGQWGVDTGLAKIEGETLLDDGAGLGARPRGESARLRFTHSDNIGISLRDFELRYLPVLRPVRSIAEDGTT